MDTGQYNQGYDGPAMFGQGFNGSDIATGGVYT
jgi:hypothetical protein